MRRVPKLIKAEARAIGEKYFSQFSASEMEEDLDEEDFNRFINANASEALKLWWEYEDKIGDEHQLLDKDGTPLKDKNGFWIQEFTMDSNGYAIGEDGQIILFSDGTPVPYPKLPELIEKMYMDEDCLAVD